MKVDLSSIAEGDSAKDYSLYDVHSVFEKNIVGEYHARMALFTAWILAETPVLMSGPRASGKTWLSDHVKQLVGDLEKDNGSCFTLTSGSDKSAWYQMDKINKAKYILILELNKLPKEAQELLKDWGEGKPSFYNTVVFTGGIRSSKKINLEPRPFVFCLADEEEIKLGEQLSSRLTVIRTDSSTDQNIAVLKRQAQLAMQQDSVHDTEYTNKLQDIRQHLQTLPLLDKWTFVNPAIDLFINAVPTFFTDCRRDFPKYIKNTNGICRFYWRHRILDKKRKIILITPQDLYLNHFIYANILVESALKVNNIEREIIFILKDAARSMAKDTVQQYLRKRGMNVSTNMVNRHLNTLCDIGYVMKSKDFDTKQNLYTSGTFFDEFTFSIKWKKVVDQCMKFIRKYYPEYADEYEQKYCKEPLVQHPFTGEMLDLNNVKEERINPAKDLKKGLFMFDEQQERVQDEPPKGLLIQEEEVI